MSSGWGPVEDSGEAIGSGGTLPGWAQSAPYADAEQPVAAGTGGSPWPMQAASATGWDDTEDSQVSQSSGWTDDGSDFFVPSKTASQVPLRIACSTAGLGLLIGAALGSSLGWVCLIGWTLCGIVTVIAVAIYQRSDLAEATSMWYSPRPVAARLRLVALTLGAIGVVVNTCFFSLWLASR